jgi:hypothetical protein
MLWGFPVLGVRVTFGTAVMARRTGWWTAACAGFPARWPTAPLGWQAVGDDPSAGGVGGIRGTRAVDGEISST